MCKGQLLLPATALVNATTQTDCPSLQHAFALVRMLCCCLLPHGKYPLYVLQLHSSRSTPLLLLAGAMPPQNCSSAVLPCMPAGGANVPALNDLLGPFGIALGDAVLEGDTTLEPDKQHFASGTHIQRFPAGGYVHGQFLQDKAVEGNFELWV